MTPAGSGEKRTVPVMFDPVRFSRRLVGPFALWRMIRDVKEFRRCSPDGFDEVVSTLFVIPGSGSLSPYPSSKRSCRVRVRTMQG